MLYEINGGDSRVLLLDDGSAMMDDQVEGAWHVFPRNGHFDELVETSWAAHNNIQGYLTDNTADHWAPRKFDSREEAIAAVIGLPEWSAYASDAGDDPRVKVAGPNAFVLTEGEHDDDASSSKVIVAYSDDELWGGYTVEIDNEPTLECVGDIKGYMHADQVIHLFLGDPQHASESAVAAANPR